MRNSFRQIVLLYRRNTLFKVLLGGLLICAFLSKLLIGQQAYVVAEEFWNLMFVFTLWIVFYLGVLIKRQMASSRACLLPGYRTPHILVMVGIYAGLVLLGVYWNYGIIWDLQMTKDALHGGYASCILMSLVILFLGYLSVWRVLLYAYLISVFVALNISLCIRIFEIWPMMQYIVAVLSVLLLIGFVCRLYALREDHAEYTTLLSWPPKLYFLNQLNFSSAPRLWYKGCYRPLRVYCEHTHIFGRACHWSPEFKVNVILTVFISMLITPVYAAVLKMRPELQALFVNAHTNVLMMSLTPVLATLGSYYKRMAYWEYDLLRPVHRHQYLKERGLLIAVQLFVYWTIMVWFVAIVPGILFHAQQFQSMQFWLSLFLTGITAALVMTWLIYMSCAVSIKGLCTNGVCLGAALIFLTYGIKPLSVPWIVLICILACLAVIVMIKMAFRSWTVKEALSN